MNEELEVISVPVCPNSKWVVKVQSLLYNSTFKGIGQLQQILPYSTLKFLIQQALEILQTEPTMLQLNMEHENDTVVVVGDTHGQFHDVCHILSIAGSPSESNAYIWNGDYVDRGAWGIEVLTLLLCWKITLPHKVLMLRGNHETVTCTEIYGFQTELEAKYGRKDGKALFKLCKKLFSSLPLAAVVNNKVLVLHGGLFRANQKDLKFMNKGKRRKTNELRNHGRERGREIPLLGSLKDLQNSTKGGQDPDGFGPSRLATDVLWSDPMSKMGMQENQARGVGILFGPDVTRDFLTDNDLQLIIRSHEGPDARFARMDMPDIWEGFCEDHVTNAGKLVTLFSAPDYPQFQESENRTNNKGAVLKLSSSNVTDYQVIQYEVSERPSADSFYDFVNALGSDDEIEIGGYGSDVTDGGISMVA